MEQTTPELHDRTTDQGRSKWSVMIDTAMKTARKKVSRAEVFTKKSRENVPPPAEETPAEVN
jgi:hypothetical protein